MPTITINGTLTLDESSGLQTGGVPVGAEDNNDNDVSLATLQSGVSDLYARLFGLVADGGLALDSSFATSNGVAQSASDFISVSGGTITSLGFVDGNGDPLPVYGSSDPGVATGLSAVDGGAIVLYRDASASLGDNLVFGVDEDGDIVFAIYMDPAAGFATASVWMVQFEALSNGDDTNPDDPENLLDSIGVAAGSSLEFNFDSLPSGSNLFGIVGDADHGLIVIGRDIGLKHDHTYIANQTQEVKTSQAGIHDTIGIESQMFDAGDAAYFTFVNDPDPNVTGFELGSTEADDADNIAYGTTLETTTAFVRVAQLQGSDAPSMSIKCFNIVDDAQGVDFIDARGVNEAGANPLITDVRVYDANDNLIESYLAPVAGNGLTISITNGIATVTGFGTNYKIEWDTNENFDQALISGVGGKFDIGGFGVTQPTTATVDIGDALIFEDDGPAIGPINEGLVDFAAGAYVTDTLNGAVGTDPNSAPYTFVDWTGKDTAISVNGTDLKGILSNDGQTVTYYADDDGVAGFGTAGDTAYYQNVLGQSGAGDYTFTVLVDPPPAETEFNFDSLPSGSNLFGIVGDADRGLVIIGRDIALKADNTYIPNQTQEIKTSQAGIHDTIGIESQMFDPGDAAYFTFVNDPDASVTGFNLGSTEADDADNIAYGSTLETSSAFIRIAQLQGGTPPSMKIQCFNIVDDAKGVDFITARGVNEAGADPKITDVRVYNANGDLIESYLSPVAGNGLTISIDGAGVATVTGFGTNYKIEWDTNEDFDQALITGNGGKFDVGGFGLLEGSPTPDQFFEFTAQATDGDGDTALACWEVGIDGTGVYDDDAVTGIEPGQPSDCVLDYASSLLAPAMIELDSALAFKAPDALLGM